MGKTRRDLERRGKSIPPWVKKRGEKQKEQEKQEKQKKKGKGYAS